MMRFRNVVGACLPVLALLGLLNSAASAQIFPFEIRIQQGNNVFVVPNGSTLTMPADAVGKVASVTVTITYRGSNSVTITNPPQLFGSTDLSVDISKLTLPLTMNPTDFFTLGLTFKPSTPAIALGQLNLSYVETFPPTKAGSTPTLVPGLIVLSLTGTTPNLAVSYFLQSNGNVVPVAQGGSVVFPPALVGTTEGATIIVSNSGSGPGSVNGIGVSGAPFQALGVPLQPATINPGTDLRFAINYSPTQVGADTGSLQISLGGVPFVASLTGSGIQPAYSYQMLTSSGSQAFTPNQTLALPDTNVGDTSTVTIQVQNTGTAVGTVSSVGVSGPFIISDVPAVAPALKPNDLFTFTLSFTPVLAGKNTGKLRIGNDLFDLTGNGLGPSLVFSYGDTASPVKGGGSVIFSPVQVGSEARLSFTVNNSGTTATTLASVGVSDTHGVFRLESLPPFPVTLAPNDSFTFAIVFAPVTTGFATSTLQIDAQPFVLSGNGLPPPPLPNLKFTGPSGVVDPASQPAVSLALAAPYPIALIGVLTLSITSSAFTPDPSVVFSTGGRTVAFSIPANGTQAVFLNGANQIQLQTGTIAGTLTITPSIATSSGLDLTPPAPPVLILTVPPAAPHLLSVDVTALTPIGFSLRVVGYSTTRSLTKLSFQFTPTSDVTTPGNQFTVDVSSAATLWYSASQSLSFGGQFGITVPFTLQSSATTITAPSSKIQSVLVSAANDQGSSNSLTATIK
jgi:hypothetical protein